MYEWLEQEISDIQSEKTHVFERDEEKIERWMKDFSWLPPSYLEFVRKFGSAKLYRRDGYYIVGVVFPPTEKVLNDGKDVLVVGHYESSEACFQRSFISPGSESPVFEFEGHSPRKVGETFEQWLRRRCEGARKSFSKREWTAIQRGPKPFSRDEEDIVEARKHYHWRFEGTADNGDGRIAVRNDSSRVLPFLTIGARAKDRSIEGKIWLNVSGIPPGEEHVVEHPAYKGQIARDNLVLFALPDPTPEDRESYWEFRS